MLPLLAVGLVVLGLAAVVGATIAISKLIASGKDADQNFSGNKVGSPVQECPPAKGPKLVSDGREAIVNSTSYKGCPDDVKKEITSKDFTDSEKKGIQEVLDKYKPLMKCDNTPVKQIGRTNKGITKNGGCVAETTTMGEWFDDSGTLVLTDAASDPTDFKDKDQQFKGTAAHELAHGLLNKFDPRTCKTYDDENDNPVMKEFRKSTGWDATGTTLTPTDTDKAPTDYAKTNSQEDLSESMMLYMYDPEKLKKESPARYEFCKTMLGDK
jgi:hypothetical protein